MKIKFPDSFDAERRGDKLHVSFDLDIEPETPPQPLIYKVNGPLEGDVGKEMHWTVTLVQAPDANDVVITIHEDSVDPAEPVPATVTLKLDGRRIAQVAYTPSVPGARKVYFENDRGTEPVMVEFVARGVTASKYTVSGPDLGEVSVPSRFVVSLVPPYAPMIVAVRSSTGKGTLNPASVSLSAETPSLPVEFKAYDCGSCDLIFENDQGLPAQSKPFFARVQAGKLVNRSNQLPLEHRYEFAYGPEFGGYLFYGPWDPARPMSYINKDIREDELDPDSDAIMKAYETVGVDRLYPQAGWVYGKGTTDEYSYLNNGAVFNVVRGDQPKVPLQYLGIYGEVFDPGPAPIDPMASANNYNDVPVVKWPWPDYGFVTDQTVHVLSPDENDYHGVLHELFHAWTDDGGQSWKHYGHAVFDGKTAKPRMDGFPSASASGFPILPLLCRYDECQRALEIGGEEGYIPHALYFTVSFGRKFSVYPCGNAAGYESGVGMGWGTRIRLKKLFYDAYKNRVKGRTRVIWNTLYRYGMFMLDFGGGLALQFASDYRWDPEDFYAFTDGTNGKAIPPSAFECLKMNYGCSIEGPSTARRGESVTYTVKRIPFDAMSYNNSIYLYTDLGTPNQVSRGAASLRDGYPVGTVSFVPDWTGTKLLSPYQNNGWWRLPDPIPLTVSD